MKTMKRLINVIALAAAAISLLSIAATVMPVSAAASYTETPALYTEVYIDGSELAAFADRYSHVVTLTGDEAVAHNNKVDDILLDSDLSAEERKLYLEQLGVYEVCEEEQAALAASSSGDVTLYKPTIHYDSSTKEYIITGNGKWNTHSYEVPTWYWWAPSVGSTKDIGGTDAIGISLTNTYGNTAGLALNSGYGRFKNGTAVKTSTTLASENDNYGGGYKVQDFIKFTKVDNYLLWFNTTFYYNAYYMTCILRYNSKLANYSGNAKLFYGHTWDTTTVTGIGVSTTGASISWSSNSDKWVGFSYARTFRNGTPTN